LSLAFLLVLPSPVNIFQQKRKINVFQIQFLHQLNHSARVTTADHAYEVKGAAGLFSWDYLFSVRSPLSVKAGEQVNRCYLLLYFLSRVFYTQQRNN
jgi:hypothetical protein